MIEISSYVMWQEDVPRHYMTMFDVFVCKDGDTLMYSHIVLGHICNMITILYFFKGMSPNEQQE